MSISVYSDVISYRLLLPKKAKYTKADAHRVVIDSLFRFNSTLSFKQACFVCRVSAIFHNTDYSKTVARGW